MSNNLTEQLKNTPQTSESKFTIQSLVNEAVSGERTDREMTHWHPSALGSCLTGQYLKRLGVKPDREYDDRMLRVFAVGKMFEDWLVDQIEKKQKVERQVRIEWPEYDLSGYADFVANGIPHEIKTVHSKAFWYMSREGGPKIQHRMQLWTYLKCLDKPEGRLIYLSKDDLAISEYIVLLSDKEIQETVEEELSILNEAWEKKVAPNPPPEDSWTAKYCRWHSQCITQNSYL